MFHLVQRRLRKFFDKPDQIWLILLFLTAAMIRFYGIWFLRWGFDESNLYNGGSLLVKSLYKIITDLNSFQYKTFVTIYGITGKYLSAISVPIGYFVEQIFNIRLPIPLGLILTRVLTSFIPNIVTMYFVYKIAKILSGSRVFVISSLVLFTFAFKHVETAHYAVPDSLTTMFTVICIYFLLLFRIIGFEKKYLIGGSVFASFAASSKIHVGLILFATIFLMLLIDFGKHKYDRKLLWFFLKILFISFFVSFVIINLLYFIDVNWWVKLIYYHIVNYPFIIRGTFLTYFYFSPPFGVGMGIVILTFAGIAVIFFHERKNHFLIPAIFCVLFYLFLSTTRGAIDRWIIPMIPIMILFAAAGIEVIYRTIAQKVNPQVASLLVGGILLLVVSRPIYNIILYDLNLVERPSTYEKIKEYVETQVDSSRCIGCYIGVGLDGVTTKLPNSIEELEKSNIEYAVFSDFWFFSRRFPKFLLNKDKLGPRRGGHWEPIRRHIETHWHLLKIFYPKYHTEWSPNIANQQVFYVYRKAS
ncbi:MAG: phospholipid carrier-dependent glycosyltransferase [bacterium]